jgi:hypothetical protein
MADSPRLAPLTTDDRLDPMTDESPEGVDRTLVRWMLSLTPDQRLDALQAFADSVWAFRDARRT